MSHKDKLASAIAQIQSHNDLIEDKENFIDTALFQKKLKALGGSSGLEMTFSMPASPPDIADMQANIAAIPSDPNQTLISHHSVDHEGTAVMDCYPDIVDGVVDNTLYQMGPAANAMFEVATKSYEVGAGEKIDQQVHADPQKMEYWEDTAFAMIYINYACKEDVARIVDKGKRREVTECFLAGVPVGN